MIVRQSRSRSLDDGCDPVDPVNLPERISDPRKAITACCAAQTARCGTYRRMENYEISEVDDGYAVLAHGRPQILFKSRGEAEAALKQIRDLGDLTPWLDVLKEAGCRSS